MANIAYRKITWTSSLIFFQVFFLVFFLVSSLLLWLSQSWWGRRCWRRCRVARTNPAVNTCPVLARGSKATVVAFGSCGVLSVWSAGSKTTTTSFRLNKRFSMANCIGQGSPKHWGFWFLFPYVLLHNPFFDEN